MKPRKQRGGIRTQGMRWALLLAFILGLGRVASVGAIPPPLPAPPPGTITGHGAVPIASPKPGASPAPTDYNVKMTADFLKYDDVHKLLVLDGNVTFTHLDTIITSPHAVFDTDKQVGHFTGGVRMSQPGTTLTGDQLDAFYAERKAVLTGDVQMITEKAPIASSGSGTTNGKKSQPNKNGKKTATHARPTSAAAKGAAPTSETAASTSPAAKAAASTSPAAKAAASTSATARAATSATPEAAAPPSPAAGKTAARNPRPGPYGPAPALPTVMLTDQMIYYWDKKEGDAIGDVKIRQGDKRAFSDRAHYTGATNQVRLFENVRFERGENDTMISEEAIVDLAKQTFTAQGGVEATVLMEQTPSPSPAIVTRQGDRVLKPAPPTVQEHPAPDGLPDHVVPGYTPSPEAP